MGYDQPCFNITEHIRVDGLVNECKENGASLGLLSLFYISKAANIVDAFRFRLDEKRVVCYDKIFSGCTILYDDKSFGFAYFDYPEDKSQFCRNGKVIIETAKKKMNFTPKTENNGLIYCSIIPWVSFTSFSHASSSSGDHSIPKIVIGKIYYKNGESYMPVSVEVHHALVDGYHVGKYFRTLEELCGPK